MTRVNLRLILAAIAMFYVVVGGLWASNYFPLQEFYDQQKIEEAYVAKHGYEKWLESPERDKARAIEQAYALTHPDIFTTEAWIGRYQSILLWGTIALSVGAGVMFLSRRRRTEPMSQ
jgi:hypothetical protein